MTTEEVISRLGREGTRVRPLPAPGLRSTLWVLWGAVYLAAVAALKMITMAPGEIILTPLIASQQVAAVLMGVTAARAALTSVVPGANAQVWRLPIVMAVVWLTLMLMGVVGDVRSLGTVGLGNEADWPCIASIALGGVLLGAPLFWMLRRGAPLNPPATAFLGGLAALSFANVEACLTQPHLFAVTVLVWHGATVLLVAALCGASGRRWLSWSSRVRRA
jgi:hypothetical protein